MCDFVTFLKWNVQTFYIFIYDFVHTLHSYGFILICAPPFFPPSFNTDNISGFG